MGKKRRHGHVVSGDVDSKTDLEKRSSLVKKDSPFVNPITKRKEQRKEKRRLKKSKRFAFCQGKEMPTISREESERRAAALADKKRAKKRKRKTKEIQKKIEARKERKQELREKKLEEEGQKLAIAKEERELRDLEKKLNMKKSRKSLPQSFVNDGLDYLFEALDTHWEEGVEELDSGQGSGSEVTDEDIPSEVEEESESDIEEEEEDDDDEEEDNDNLDTDGKIIEVLTSSSEIKPKSILKSSKFKKNVKTSENESSDDEINKSGFVKKLKRKMDVESDSHEKSSYTNTNIENLTQLKQLKKNQHKQTERVSNENKKVKFMSESSDGDSETASDENDDEESDGDIVCDDDDVASNHTDDDDDDDDDNDDIQDENDDGSSEEEVEEESDNSDEGGSDAEKQECIREDIYGRTLDKDGKVVKNQGIGAYIPPAKRALLAKDSGKRKLMLDRLRKQLKGLINRASESNMQPISTQIEDLYMSNSRADVNELLTELILDSCVSPILTPERLCQELAMLVAILHGNVGMEVGAYFLQCLAKKFESKFTSSSCVGNESKEIDNVVMMLANLYNFKIVQSMLLFDVIRKFVKRFEEKDIELILQLLKTAGFSLRKDDPVGLKDLLLEVQTAAGAVDTSNFTDKSRVRFMLDVLLAIKNNNMRKIPNYDPDHLEHLRKLIRNYIKNGSLGSNQLNIGLDDLLKSEERGRWWVVGSAWGGRDPSANTQETTTSTPNMSQEASIELMELARKQRMNTDIRKTIFYVIMTSEDYIDAFEKLLKLGLKHQQEREIIHVILECCLQEKKYNQYYTYLAQKFCELDRRFQMTLQFSLWDKFKEMSNLSQVNRENLASFVAHLLLKKGISLSVMKVVEFGTLDKAMVRFLKSFLTTVLLADDQKEMEAVFERIAPLDKLRHLQEGLKLFMKHFLLRGQKSSEVIDLNELTSRVKVADKALSVGQHSMLL